MGFTNFKKRSSSCHPKTILWHEFDPKVSLQALLLENEGLQERPRALGVLRVLSKALTLEAQDQVDVSACLARFGPCKSEPRGSDRHGHDT